MPAKALRLALLLVAILAAGAREALALVANRTPVPDSGPCDIVLTEADAPRLQTLLNDPNLRVFCAEPGDYRNTELVIVFASGTESARRYLKFHADDVQPALHRAEQAIFESLRFRGSWWVVQGITVQPRDWDRSKRFLGIEGGDHNVVEYSLVDGIDFPAQTMHSGIHVVAFENDPASYNVIRYNVVRRGNQPRLPVDYTGITVHASELEGVNSDFNQIVDNEIYDWGDGVVIQAGDTSCSRPGKVRGTLIDGNDIYITPDKRANCDGTPNPEGACSCSENAVDIKHDPGADPVFWTRVTNNRVWGFRPTTVPSCGGSGANGVALAAGSVCAKHLLVAGNLVVDSTMAMNPASSSWVIAGNLIHDVGRGIFPIPDTTDLKVEFNTMVGTGHAYDDNASFTAARCNAVIDDLGLDGRANPRGEQNEAIYNFLYAASSANFAGPTNATFALPEESANQERCFARRRWTGPEQICIPFAQTTQESPHAAAIGECGSTVATSFDLAPIDFDSTLAVPEPGGGAGASSSLVALGCLAIARGRAPKGSWRE